MARARARSLVRSAARPGAAGARPGLQRQRMVHQRDERRRTRSSSQLRQRAEGEAVDQDDRLSGRRAAEQRPGLAEVRHARQRERTPGSAGAAPSTPCARQLRQHAPVVGVAAGRASSRSPGMAKTSLSHATGPSNQARATCDSCSVTRIVDDALGARPEPPVAARRRPCASKTWRHRNSVVVWRPANSRHLVEIAVVQRRRGSPSARRARGRCRRRRCRRSALAEERDVDDEGRAVQALRRAEQLARAGCGRS